MFTILNLFIHEFVFLYLFQYSLIFQVCSIVFDLHVFELLLLDEYKFNFVSFW